MPECAPVEQAFLATCTLVPTRYGVDANALVATIRERSRQLWQQGPIHDYCVAIGISSWEGLTSEFEGDGPELAIMREWVAGYRKRSWNLALQDHKINDESLVDQLSRSFKQENRQRYVTYPETHDAMRVLRECYTLAMLTNGIVDVQNAKIDAASLRPYFTTVVISSEVGIGKPSGTPFEVTLERLGVNKDEAVMVGNSLSRDVGGAQAAGIFAVWMNRDDSELHGESRPDAQIRLLSELTAVLDSQ